MTSEMLQLRGAIDLLEKAKKIILRDNERPKSRNDAWFILQEAEVSLSKDLKALMGQSKEFNQAIALGGIK